MTCHKEFFIRVVLSARLDILDACSPNNNTIYCIIFPTKVLMVGVVGLPVEEGALSWDKPIPEHLPEF